MAKKQKIKKTLLIRISNLRLVRILYIWLNKVTLPGFRGMSIYDVVKFFILGLQKSSLLCRANSLSFTFTLAVFPLILFFFTLIPYIPIDGLQASILNTLSDVLPDQVFKFIEQTILDIVSKQNRGLLSLGFFMAFYFSTQGVIGIMKAFNRSAHTKENRSGIKMRLAAFWLQLMLVIIILIAAALLILTPVFLHYVSENSILTSGFAITMINIAKWVILGLLMFLNLSVIYYFAPAGKRIYRFFSPGATIATLLGMVSIVFFNMYIENFSQYNKLYGSIGAIIVLMLFINLNSIVLLIGFELNASIYDAHLQHNNPDEDEDD